MSYLSKFCITLHGLYVFSRSLVSPLSSRTQYWTSALGQRGQSCSFSICELRYRVFEVHSGTSVQRPCARGTYARMECTKSVRAGHAQTDYAHFICQPSRCSCELRAQALRAACRSRSPSPSQIAWSAWVGHVRSTTSRSKERSDDLCNEPQQSCPRRTNKAYCCTAHLGSWRQRSGEPISLSPVRESSELIRVCSTRIRLSNRPCISVRLVVGRTCARSCSTPSGLWRSPARQHSQHLGASRHMPPCT